MKDTTTATRDRPHRPSETPGSASPRPLRLRMAGDATAVRDARQLVEGVVAGQSPDVRHAAVLLAGEVVTNAVMHGGGWFLIQVDLSRDLLRVEVTDSTAGHPRVLQMTDGEHGRGMAIVDSLATTWGTDHLGSHKVVWFELGIPH
ncbi:MAG TPA: ATP-binding protein [Acidimicrobiales bacterium]|nr:ATP-binding protein [Acidimicrobiales bacterium]